MGIHSILGLVWIGISLVCLFTGNDVGFWSSTVISQVWLVGGIK